MKFNSIQIESGLYLNIRQIQTDQGDNSPSKPKHQFLIFDRSGSMYGDIDQVIDVAKQYCNSLEIGDKVSIGYFASTNEYGLSVPYTLRKQIDGVITTLQSYKRTLGCTNFIQILNKVVEVASTSTDQSSLFFFTDGCHNSGGGRKQIQTILTKWQQISGITMFVGCGYIDRQMLSWMANISNGSFIHLQSFSMFGTIMNQFNSSINDISPSYPIKLNRDEVFPISISGQSIIQYNIKDFTINFKPSKTHGKLYTLSQVPISDYISNSGYEQVGIRGLSYILSQKMKTDMAIKLLNSIGDVFLIERLYNAVTPQEFSKAQALIKNSVFIEQFRYMKGIDTSFVPRDDAMCVFDVIKDFLNHDDIKLHISDKRFSYNKISKVPAIQQDGAKIEYTNDIIVKFNTLVMHKQRLNVSISTHTQGTVNLLSQQFVKNPPKKEQLQNLNIPQRYKINVFRTYNIIADGKLNTDILVVSGLSDELIDKYTSIITQKDDNGICVVSLKGLPLINKTYRQTTSGIELAKLVWEQKVLMDQLSVFNYLKKQESQTTDYKYKQADDYLLQHCYIKNGGYNPPMTTIKQDDVYQVYSFDIKLHGFSKVSASSVIKKLQSGKTPTNRQIIVANTYKNIQESNLTNLAYLTDKYTQINKLLQTVRYNIQLSKFAIILSNHGNIDQFTDRNNMKLELNLFGHSGQVFEKVGVQFVIDKIQIKI